MEFNDLLAKQGIDPAGVLVMRHRPHEPELRKVLPWLAAERHNTFNAYQQSQVSANVESALTRADHLASFFGHEARKAVFLGLYKRGDWQDLTHEQYWSVPAYQEMKAFGIVGFTGERKTIRWFNLERTDFYSEWKGRLIINWPGIERGWYRWASKCQIPIQAVLDKSMLDQRMPLWHELNLSWHELAALPARWRAALQEWRGIYFIFDVSDGKGCVGSAYGTANILGRWLNYSQSGHGGNSKLRGREPANFRFSILQRVSPDMESAEVIGLESSWKDRLHTRSHGLNEN